MSKIEKISDDEIIRSEAEKALKFEMGMGVCYLMSYNFSRYMDETHDIKLNIELGAIVNELTPKRMDYGEHMWMEHNGMVIDLASHLQGVSSIPATILTPLKNDKRRMKINDKKSGRRLLRYLKDDIKSAIRPLGYYSLMKIIVRNKNYGRTLWSELPDNRTEYEAFKRAMDNNIPLIFENKTEKCIL